MSSLSRFSSILNITRFTFHFRSVVKGQGKKISENIKQKEVMECFSLKKINMEIESDKEIGLGRAEIHMKMSVLSVLYGQSLC